MSLNNWIENRELVISELELWGRLSEEDIILEVDSTQGVAGAINQIQSAVQTSIATIDSKAETDLLKLKEKLRKSEYPNRELTSYVNEKKLELKKFIDENDRDVNWIKRTSNLAEKGIGFLVKMLKGFFSIVFKPVVKRLYKVFSDGLGFAIHPSGNLVILAVALSIIVNMSYIVASFVSSSTMLGPVMALALVIYFRAANGFINSLVQDNV